MSSDDEEDSGGHRADRPDMIQLVRQDHTTPPQFLGFTKCANKLPTG